MKLTYHTGNNFGDALNPYIFNHFFSNFFDDNDEVLFLGIGSILGLKRGNESTRLKIVFSSGFADGMSDTYGTLPELDNSYDVFCVRGPLTAQKWNLDKSKAIADGAILLSEMGLPKKEKKYKYSFMPHIGSEMMYNWKPVIKKAGIHYISPANNYKQVLDEILETELLITEAMHGAIVADALRVPWLPVFFYPTINEFKWKDFALSMELGFNPLRYKAPYSNKFVSLLFQNKIKAKAASKLLGSTYGMYRNLVLERDLLSYIEGLKKKDFILSDDSLLIQKSNLLLEQIELCKKKYSR